jgi:HEAT repeat protein
VDFDPDGFIDKTVEFAKPVSALVAEATHDPHMMSRLWAVQQLGSKALGDADARMDALMRALDADRFYAVRAAAATSLGTWGTDRAKVVLLVARRQASDSRVRTAIYHALGAFTRDGEVYDAMTDALKYDASYAVRAAAATELGHSGVPQAFVLLQDAAGREQETHVMQAVLGALAATRDPRAWDILLSEARPGVAERIRETALRGLETLRDVVPATRVAEVGDVVRAALHDPFYPTQAVGEELVGAFDLGQFEADIQHAAQDAPLVMGRDLAEHVLAELRRGR